jgi:hypothetical protein
MSYSTIARCANDPAFADRVRAASAQEGTGSAVPAEYLWDISAKSDIEAAYASAVAAGNDNPGGDESVITDGMILSAVQADPPTS